MSLVMSALCSALEDVGYKVYWEYVDPQKKTVSMKGYFQGKDIEVEITEET